MEGSKEGFVRSSVAELLQGSQRPEIKIPEM